MSTKYQIVTVYPPKKKDSKAICFAEVIFLQPTYIKAEDWNADTKKSYTQAEGVVNAGFKTRVTVIPDKNGQPMIVGSVLPPFDTGRSIARDAIEQLNNNQAA